MTHINLIKCKAFTFSIIFVLFVSCLFLLFLSFFLALFFLKKEALRFFEILVSVSQSTVHNSQDLSLQKEKICHRIHV
jgi:predicted permease